MEKVLSDAYMGRFVGISYQKGFGRLEVIDFVCKNAA
jgi:hypothetical protein